MAKARELEFREHVDEDDDDAAVAPPSSSSSRPQAIGASSLEELDLDSPRPPGAAGSKGKALDGVQLPRLDRGRHGSVRRTKSQDIMSKAKSTVRVLVKVLSLGMMVLVCGVAVIHWPPWVIEDEDTRAHVMSVLFLVGLFIVAVEDIVGINKSAMMMVMAAVMWTFLAVGYHPNKSKAGAMELHEELNRGLQDVGSVLLFLLPAMGVVETIDHFDGFALVTLLIGRAVGSKKEKLMPIVCVLTFFLSSVIDNLTSTIVAVKVLRRLLPDDEEFRKPCGGLVVIAANAGGAWSPIGDVTTTMLWIQGKISATSTVRWLLLPSLVAGVLPLAGFMWQARPSNNDSSRHRGKDQKRGPGWEREHLFEDACEIEGRDISCKKVGALIMGVVCILMVPALKMGCGLPPYLGMLLALGIIWLLTDLLGYEGEAESVGDDVEQSAGGEDDVPLAVHDGPPQEGVVSALKKVDLTGLLFFTGVLLAVGALDAAGVLKQYSRFMNKITRGSAVKLSILIGVSSAVVDNVPLVEAAIDMFREVKKDDPLWQLVALGAGTGGSILSVGSISGVTLMSMEKVGFLWYCRNVSLWAGLGFILSIGVYQLERSMFG
eukprot:TRINITY_DN34489_c0_g1_i1.p1 TRINITY_DN34489_c0_g1~~TRINITY_DN34489_c0_g1_i1.p1  ORF type:complete len:626 (-),score=120.72 TRINITY_DN34489_c0_g1_i1:145-1953(-)